VRRRGQTCGGGRVPRRVLRAGLLDRPPAHLLGGERLQLDVLLMPVRVLVANGSGEVSANERCWLLPTTVRSWSERWIAGSIRTSRRVHAGVAALAAVAAAPPRSAR
jgi:hypothetical protein